MATREMKVVECIGGDGIEILYADNYYWLRADNLVRWMKDTVIQESKRKCKTDGELKHMAARMLAIEDMRKAIITLVEELQKRYGEEDFGYENVP